MLYMLYIHILLKLLYIKDKEWVLGICLVGKGVKIYETKFDHFRINSVARAILWISF